MSISWRFCRKERRKMAKMVLILKMLGMGCLIVLAAFALMILVACFVAVAKALINMINGK